MSESETVVERHMLSEPDSENPSIEGLIERLKGAADLYKDTVAPGTARLLLQAANTISRLKGELGKAEFIIADTGAMLDHFDGLGVANDRPDSRAFSDRIEDIALRSLQLEAEIKELRSVLSEALDSMLAVGVVHEGDIHANDPVIAKARSLLSPSQDVGVSSARASRDARSSTRPDSPRSDEGGEA